MSLRLKLNFFLLIVFLLVGFSVSFFLAKNIEKTEFNRLQEDNQRIVKTLTQGFFSDLKTWEESQTPVGPYGFEKSGVKELMERFINFYQLLTGQKIILLNIYNDKNLIIASNFKELEGMKVKNPSVEKVFKTGLALSEIENPKEIHPYPNILIDKKITAQKIFETYQPIEIESRKVGVIESYFEPELKLRERIQQTIGIISLGFLLIVAIVYLFFSRMILKPIQIIRKATEPIGQGVFSGYVKEVTQKDEMGKLGEDFNSMIRGLNSLSGEIGRLKEIGRIKSEFISIAAHQLRTPLSGIKWILELALEKEMNQEIKNWLAKINELNERMIGMISDLLSAARLEEGRFGFNFQENVDLLSLFQKTIESYKIKAEARGLNFSYSYDDFKNLRLKADPEKLKIALDNIIENALNYTPKGGMIKIELEKPDGLVIIKISDTGIGIKEEDLARLFGKFFRGQNAISFQPSGSGIGLFITKNIIKAHHGEIWVESKMNQGTIFYIKLPLSQNL